MVILETDALLAAICILLTAVATVTVYKYVKTRDGGLIWLAMGLAVWPAISMVLWVFIVPKMAEQVQTGQTVMVPFSLVARRQISVGNLLTRLSWLRDLIASLLILVGMARLYTKRAAQRS